MRNLTISVLTLQEVTTTLARAKAARRMVEHVITLGKTGNLQARRRAIALLGNATIARRLFSDLAPAFAARRGGYTRIVRLGTRRGDGAQLALLELTERVAGAPPAATAAPREKHTSAAPVEPSPQLKQPKPAKPTTETHTRPERAPQQPTPPQKPRKLFEGLRQWWGRRQGGRGGGGSRG